MNQGLKSKLWDPFLSQKKPILDYFKIYGSSWYLYQKKFGARKKILNKKKNSTCDCMCLDPGA